jgi:hypothetical protein
MPASGYDMNAGAIRMDKTIRKYASFDEMKADEYRYWQSRPVHERVQAVSELTQELYAMKGAGADAFRLQRTLVRFERLPGKKAV